MKRKLMLLTILCITLMLSSCKNDDDLQLKGVNIFSDNRNIHIEYLPEKKIDFSSAAEAADEVILINTEGKMTEIKGDFQLDVRRGKVFALKDERKIDENIVSIYAGEAIHGIGKLHSQTIELMDKNIPTMGLLLDGFSYEQYRRLSKEGRIPFLEKIFSHKAISVYMPVTNAGFASIITGALPYENGVHDRTYRDIKVESIFGHALKNNKRALLIEGDIKILNTEIEPVLHIDINKDNDVDDEIYKKALESASEGYDLIFIHFHGIDDRGHSFGPYSKETLGYIERIDRYIKELSENWAGALIATADHGMNESDSGGEHGACTYEDMIVPYFAREMDR